MLYNRENPHGGDLYSVPVRIDFSANINPFGTPEHIKEAVRRSADEVHNYPDTYCRELVKAVASFEGVAPEYVFFGSGAAEVIFLYAMAARPERTLLLAPTFSEYESALTSMGLTCVRHHLTEESDFTVGEDILSSIDETEPSLVLLCNPNNPTGRLCDPELMERIYDKCRERGIRLFVDECFLDLTKEGDRYSLKGKLSEYKGLTILKAFTKSFGMAGLRLGYCLCADSELLTAMSGLTQPWNISVPAQMAGRAALSDTSFLKKATDMVSSQRPLLEEGLRKLGLRVIPSSANYILFYSDIELKAPMMERGILIRSCDNYPGLGKGWYRVAVKLPEENADLLSAMGEILRG